MNKSKRIGELFSFIEASPTAFHTVAEIQKRALSAGFTQLEEKEEWSLREHSGYFVIRNDSSVILFQTPEGLEPKAIRAVAAHSDSPTFKVKENASYVKENHYCCLNTEGYGGAIWNTFLDRPLSVAGRVAYEKDGSIVSRLIHINRDLLVIPSLAIHMNRTVNSGVELNAQKDMIPLYAMSGNKDFLDLVAEEAKLRKNEILAYDLYLYVREQGKLFGANKEFILAPRLDDLQCVYSSVTALLENHGSSQRNLNVCAIFDNEEVGSSTRQGADSTFFSDVLCRIGESLGKNENWIRKILSDSFLISADNAHALHPNHPEKSDPTNRPVLNKGIVIKFHGGQKYTSDAITAAECKRLCNQAKVPYQVFTNRSDQTGGSTLGNISIAHVSIPSVDIGLPQLAMHSAVETAGAMDLEYALKLLKAFYGGM